METEASRGLGYAGVPCGTSSKNRPTGNEGIRLKANWYEGVEMAEDWMSKVSKPEYRVKAEKDIFITARDGVRLAADIFGRMPRGNFPRFCLCLRMGRMFKS